MLAGPPCNYQCRFLLAAPGMGTSGGMETSEGASVQMDCPESLWFRGVTCGTSGTRMRFVFGVDKKRCVNVLWVNMGWVVQICSNKCGMTLLQCAKCGSLTQREN